MNENKTHIRMNSFFWSQFSYCLIVWMFHSHTLNNKINRLDERWLKIVYNDKKLIYENLLVRDRTFFVHKESLQILATKMVNIHGDLSPPIFKEIPNKRTFNYELRHLSQFIIPTVERVYNGFKSLACLGPKIRNMVPSELKEMSSIKYFKGAIKEWYPRNCPCRLWNIGFI